MTAHNRAALIAFNTGTARARMAYNADMAEQESEPEAPVAKEPATHCGHGHFYDYATTYIRPDGVRVCRACAADRTRRARAEKRSA